MPLLHEPLSDSQRSELTNLNFVGSQTAPLSVRKRCWISYRDGREPAPERQLGCASSKLGGVQAVQSLLSGPRKIAHRQIAPIRETARRRPAAPADFLTAHDLYTTIWRAFAAQRGT
jgi:hypothetical protein